MVYEFEKAKHPDFKDTMDVKTCISINQVSKCDQVAQESNKKSNEDLEFECFVLETKLRKMCTLFDSLLVKTRAYKQKVDELEKDKSN